MVKKTMNLGGEIIIGRPVAETTQSVNNLASYTAAE